MDKNSKIYVAGHLGLVGSAIWNNLLSKGYSNLIGKSIDEMDLMDTAAIKEFFDKEKPEYVLIAAAKVGGIHANNTYRGQFIYENLMIQNNIIHQSYIHNVKKLLFLGSTCIYPRKAPQPMSEDCLLTSPLEYTNEPYAIAKIAGIKMCESYNLQYGTNFLSVMPTNLYGPNDNFNLETSHVLPAIIRKMYLGLCLEQNELGKISDDINKRPIEGVNGSDTKEKILSVLSKYGVSKLPGADINKQKVQVEIWGSGNPKREFLWSEEMADACVFVLEHINFSDVSSKQKEIRNTHINIGTGKEVTIKELSLLIKKIIGYNGEIIFNAEKPDGTLRKLTNPEKIHTLGWHHKIDIEEGVKKLYEWYLKK
jgi:GDP-L-fucose synthase